MAEKALSSWSEGTAGTGAQVLNFWLGTHETGWLHHTAIPLFISRRRLDRLNQLPRARGSWALDSGGFSELLLFGKWTMTAADYAQRVRRYRDVIGRLAWAAPQDWMCEPSMLTKTGLTIADHQRLTLENYLELRSLAPDLPIVPVLQGWTLDDYLRHVEAYQNAGIELADRELVGVGTLCRRQHTATACTILQRLDALGLKLHGFGVKMQGLDAGAQYLASADSLAWSFQARRKRLRLPGCQHRTCSSCIKWALQWRERVLARIAQPQQTSLFA